MTERKDESQLPTVSGPESGDAQGAAEPVPQVEGYEITGKLGQGGMGTVWRAQQLGTRREVALKLLGAGAFTSDKARARFEREVELAARLNHPNIARVFDSGIDRGRYYYAMQLIDGLALDEYVEKDKLSQKQILELMRTVSQGVQHAHQRGVIHRDLKPSNVLVTADGQPHVLDFGLAKTFLEGDRGVTVSMDGDVAGTPAYMSPEQAAGHTDQITTATDVYSLGVILYRLLTGKSPHDLSGTRYEVLRRIAEEEVTRPREITREIDKELEAVLLKSLAHEAKLRYASAADLAADIHNYLTGEPLNARPPSMVYFLKKRVHKHRIPVAVAATVLVAVIGMAIFAYVRIAQERDTADQARQRANQEAERVRQEKLTSDQRLYVADMRLAQRAWEDTDILRLLELLGGQRPHRTGDIDLRGFEWYYWWNRYHRELVMFTGHTGSVLSLAFSPDGKRLATAGNTVKVWDAVTARGILTLKGHTGRVYSVAFSPDGKRLASADWSIVQVWDAVTGQEVLTLKGHTGVVFSVAFSPDGKRLASASDDETVKVWDAARPRGSSTSGREVMTLKGHTGRVSSVAFSPDGKRLASASYDKTVKIWDAETGREGLTLKGHTGGIRSVAFSPDGKRLASGSMDHSVKIWDAGTGQEVLTIRGHTGYVLGVAFSPDGKRLASGSYDKTVKVWDAATGQEVLTLRGHVGFVYGVAFSPDGKRLASGSWDKTVKVWDAERGQEVLTLKGHTHHVCSVAFSPDGKRSAGDVPGGRLASASSDKTVKIWDAATGQEVLTLKGHKGYVLSVAFSPDGKRLASASWDKTVKVWDAATGQEVLTLKGGGAISVAFSPDGKRLASGSYTTVRVWDAATGQEVLTLKGHSYGVTSLAFSPDGKRLASGSYDKTVKVWDAVTGQEVLTLKGHIGDVYSVAFSPDGKRLASASLDNTVKVWDAVTGQEILTLKGHIGDVYSVAFSPDGKRLASASSDETVKIWDAGTGQEVLTLKGHTSVVMSVAFSPDGKRLASGSWDNTVKIWGASDPAGSKVKPPTKTATAPTKPAATRPSGVPR